MTTAEHSSMNTIIHAAFRRDLVRFDQALARFSPEAPEPVPDITSAWDNFAYQLHHHHVDEETIFWPTLRTLGASDHLAEQLETEHVQMITALEGADLAMERFAANPMADSAVAARRAIAKLAEVLTDHLGHEERDMEPISAASHATPQIKAAQKAARRSHRGNTGTLFAWLLDGANERDVLGLQREVPRPVLFVLTRTSGRRYRRVVSTAWV